ACALPIACDTRSQSPRRAPESRSADGRRPVVRLACASLRRQRPAGRKIVAVGLLIGLVGAATMTQLLTALLFEIKPTDGITYASVVALLGVMSTLAINLTADRQS